jgi:hypothetical protein
MDAREQEVTGQWLRRCTAEFRAGLLRSVGSYPTPRQQKIVLAATRVKQKLLFMQAVRKVEGSLPASEEADYALAEVRLGDLIAELHADSQRPPPRQASRSSYRWVPRASKPAQTPSQAARRPDQTRYPDAR